MDGGGIYRYKHNTDNNREKDIDKGGHKPFCIDPYFLKNTECFAAAGILKFLVGQLHGMLQAFREDGGAKFLGDQAEEIILESLGDAADHRHTYRGKQQPYYTVNGFSGFYFYQLAGFIGPYGDVSI